MEHDQLEVPPIYLPVGTEVSAKFKGAFCEARITKLVKLVKIKIQLRDSNIVTVDEAAIQNGRMEINQNVEFIHMKQVHKGLIIFIKDCSSYTVIFNDGDERILKRTQLCQKSAKHFKDTETLDKLPLYHPDKRSKKKKEEAEKNYFALNVSPNSQRSPLHYRSSSVTPLKGIASTRSATRAIAQLQFEESERSASAAADCFSSEEMSDLPPKSNSLSPSRNNISDSENEELFRHEQQSTSTAIVAEKVEIADTKPKAVVIDLPNNLFSSGTAVIVSAFAAPKFGGRVQLGMVVSHEEFKTHCKSQIPLPHIENNQVPFRSFQNGRYALTSFDRLRKFDQIEAQKLTDFGSMGLKVAFERANNYVLRGELPQSWSRKLDSVDLAKKKSKKAEKVSESSSSDDESEYNERRDLCVAHFYKFQDESGNQLNKVPLLGGKEIDIYRFYDVVSRMGGHKRVTQDTGWRKVLRKMHLEDTGVSPTTVKNSYIRHFEKFESFMKNLGYSSLTVSSSTPSTNSRTTRIIRGYNQAELKLTDQKKKTRPKEQRSLDRGQSISQEVPESSIKSRSGSFSSAKAASPAVTAATKPHEQLSHDLGKSLSEVTKLKTVNDGANIGPNQERTNLNDEKAGFSEKSSCLLEIMEKKQTESQEFAGSRSTSTEGSLNKKEANETTTSVPLPKKLQGIRGRKPKIPRDQRTKSPTGHQAVLEDVGYTNAHIFTRFYQGQNVHARHHLRFYDARVIMLKQPSLHEIATSLCDAFDLSIISRQISQNLTDLSYENMGTELKRVLHEIMLSTKIFVHYLGWNSRYDEWLMLHKIRVDEKDEKSSSRALEQLMLDQLPAELVAVAMNWCHSDEGIASLTALPGAQSSEQRPRRLSAATLTKTNTNVVRKNSEVMPPREPDKQNKQQQQYVHQIITSNNIPLEECFSSTPANCVYSAPPLPSKHVSPSDLVITSPLSSCSSSHIFVSSPTSSGAKIDNEQSSSASDPVLISIKKDSAGHHTSLVTMAPYSIVVKTSQSPECANNPSLDKKPNFLTSSRPIDGSTNDSQGVCLNYETMPPHCQPSLKEVDVDIQSHLIKRVMPKSDCQADCQTTIFVNTTTSEHCKLSAKVFSNYERKVVVFQPQLQHQQIPIHHETMDGSKLSGDFKTAYLKEGSKSCVAHNQQQQPIQQSQNATNKKRTAPIGPMSPPSKILKQTNKTTGRGGGKTSTDATTETSEDDESTEGNQSISMHSIKQRVLQKMENEHLFDSYSFVGLSELDDDLAKCVSDPDEQVRLIEGRMRELREIYHKYKGKLADLEKEHKKRQRQEKKNARKVGTDK